MRRNRSSLSFRQGSARVFSASFSRHRPRWGAPKNPRRSRKSKGRRNMPEHLSLAIRACMREKEEKPGWGLKKGNRRPAFRRRRQSKRPIKKPTGARTLGRLLNERTRKNQGGTKTPLSRCMAIRLREAGQKKATAASSKYPRQKKNPLQSTGTTEHATRILERD